MKFMLSLLALAYVVWANPAPSLPVNPGGIGGLFKGPNSETIIKGPDGSVITAAAEGGKVHSGLQPIVVAEPAPVEVAIATTPEVIVTEAPKVQSSDLIGPSGRISTHGQQSIVAGPASTTITGPAVVAETVVSGPPLIASAAPILTVTESPIRQISAVTTGPILLSGSGVDQISTVTAAPIAALTALGDAAVSLSTPVTTLDNSPLLSVGDAISTAALSTLSPIDASHSSVSINNAATLPVSSIVTPGGVASASVLSEHSVATASSSSNGATVTASATPNLAAATIQNQPNIAISAIQPNGLPWDSSIVSSTIAPNIHQINDHIDLGGIQLAQDQLAIDNRQININPALIPPGNIIPPEIRVGPKGVVGNAAPQVSTLQPLGPLVTAGLGSIGAASSIQRAESDGLLRSNVGISGRVDDIALAQQQQLAVQRQVASNQIPVNARWVNPQAAGSVVNITPSPVVNGKPLLSPTLENIQQQELLNAELAKVGIDASQLRLANIPLSAVSGVPPNINGVADLSRVPVNVNGASDLSRVAANINGAAELSRIPANVNGIVDLSRVPVNANGASDLSRVAANINGAAELSRIPANVNGIADLSRIPVNINGAAHLSRIPTNINGVVDLSRVPVNEVVDLSQVRGEVGAPDHSGGVLNQDLSHVHSLTAQTWGRSGREAKSDNN